MLNKFSAKPLEKAVVDKLIAKSVAELKNLPGLEEIILFGSAARGEMTDASDLDFVLIFSDEKHAKSGRRLLHTVRTPPYYPSDFICVHRDLYIERAAIGGVLMIAKDEGISVYQRKGIDGSN